MKKNFQKGFTLIDLLVVIELIGILASVVLASLNSARSMGADAAVKSAMSNMRAQAELYYDNNSSQYGTAAGTSCTQASSIFADPQIAAMITQIDAQDGGTPSCAIGGTNQQNWAVMTTLKTGTTWCVDNSGWAKAGTAVTAGKCS